MSPRKQRKRIALLHSQPSGTALKTRHLPAEHALISLLALNGLRVSEATGAAPPGRLSSLPRDAGSVEAVRQVIPAKADGLIIVPMLAN